MIFQLESNLLSKSNCWEDSKTIFFHLTNFSYNLTTEVVHLIDLQKLVLATESGPFGPLCVGCQTPFT